MRLAACARRINWPGANTAFSHRIGCMRQKSKRYSQGTVAIIRVHNGDFPVINSISNWLMARPKNNNIPHSHSMFLFFFCLFMIFVFSVFTAIKQKPLYGGHADSILFLCAAHCRRRFNWLCVCVCVVQETPLWCEILRQKRPTSKIKIKFNRNLQLCCFYVCASVVCRSAGNQIQCCSDAVCPEQKGTTNRNAYYAMDILLNRIVLKIIKWIRLCVARTRMNSWMRNFAGDTSGVADGIVVSRPYGLAMEICIQLHRNRAANNNRTQKHHFHTRYSRSRDDASPWEVYSVACNYSCWTNKCFEKGKFIIHYYECNDSVFIFAWFLHRPLCRCI